MPSYKLCPRCQATKPDSEFYRNHTTPDGLSAYCKSCTKEYLAGWREEKRESYLATQNRFHERHREDRNKAKREARLTKTEKA